MAGKLYQELVTSEHFQPGKYLDADDDDAVLNGLSGLTQHNNLNHNPPNLLPGGGLRDRGDHHGSSGLLGLPSSSVALPPPRERDQSLFNLPDDLPQFQRASTTEIFDTLNINGLGPSALVSEYYCYYYCEELIIFFSFLFLFLVLFIRMNSLVKMEHIIF